MAATIITEDTLINEVLDEMRACVAQGMRSKQISILYLGYSAPRPATVQPVYYAVCDESGFALIDELATCGLVNMHRIAFIEYGGASGFVMVQVTKEGHKWEIAAIDALVQGANMHRSSGGSQDRVTKD